MTPRTPSNSAVDLNEPQRSGSNAKSMQSLLQKRLDRRTTLKGGLGLAATTFFAGAGLAGCSSDDDDPAKATTPQSPEPPKQLTFASVAGTTADTLTLPEGYTADILIPWGTPTLLVGTKFNPDHPTAAAQLTQAGMHHDGMKVFQQDDPNSGLLVTNHENITAEVLFPQGITKDAQGLPSDPQQVRLEMAAHGISVTRIHRQADKWTHHLSSYNRRITANTPCLLTGPAALSKWLVTPYSLDASEGRGTLNNCGAGSTPWNTYLSGEENFQSYFVSRDNKPEHERYGISTQSWKSWHAVAAHADAAERDLFARFDITESAAEPQEDWRNEANQFGWVVEVDPYDPTSLPKKRTALGRFRHEGVAPSPIVPGKRLAFYMGDDARGEYCYKFVTNDVWDPNHPDPDMLDHGTLYVARFNNDGTGQWLPLDINKSPKLAQHFSSQAEVLVKTRLAADLLNPTPMDRPEWSTVDPVTGDIYYTMTNNSDRGQPGEEAVNAANPRPKNEYGHIIRQREHQGDPTATRFHWDIFAFGGPAKGDKKANPCGLTAANQFASPDGIWFDPRGILWIQTDNGGNAVADATNNQMLAVIPANLDKGYVNAQSQAQLKRFLVGPAGSEITGCDLSKDQRTLFVNVQHPSGGFPDYAPDMPPRSATLAIRRLDKGVIAL